MYLPKVYVCVSTHMDPVNSQIFGTPANKSDQDVFVVLSLDEDLVKRSSIANVKPGSRAWVNYKVNTMRSCPYFKEHSHYFGAGDPGMPVPAEKGKCGMCDWFTNGNFSPIKFLGTCGRRSNTKRDGLPLYCTRAKTGSGRCAYHQAVYRKKNPWL